MARLKTMFWGKQQRIITDKYRENYDKIFKKQKNNKPSQDANKSQSDRD